MNSRFLHSLAAWFLLSSLLMCGGPLSPSLCQEVADELALTLPPEFYGVVGEPTAIYFDNIVLAKDSSPLKFSVECGVGQTQSKAWVCAPTEDDVGTHQLAVTVHDSAGKQISTAKTTFRVSRPIVAGKSLRVLVIGDSLTHASQYPNELFRLYNQNHGEPLLMLGTHHPAGAAENVFHEGYGGWTWQRFVTKYEPNPDGTYRKRSSPFVFLNKDSKPALDVSRYIRENCKNDPPDVVFFMLGINDCFSAPTKKRAELDARITGVLSHGETLIKAFRQAAPDADLAVCLTTPGNSRDGAFVANYQDRYPRWGWKQIQHRLVTRQVERYADRQDEHIYIVPTQLNLDIVDGYPENNAVHPNGHGYKQIGSTLYAWLAAHP